MLDSADSNWVRIGGYIVVAGLALIARRREGRRVVVGDHWPPFWLWTAGLLVVMAIGRVGGVGDVIAEVGRSEARNSGWYGDRRPLQAAAVIVMGCAWLVAVTLACWRTPERRRRYLPFGLVIVTIGAFAAIRMVSLHQVDAVLYRRHIGDVRIGTVVEVTLLVLAGAMTWWVPRGPLDVQGQFVERHGVFSEAPTDMAAG